MELTINSGCLFILLGADLEEFKRLVTIAPDAELFAWHAILESMTNCDSLVDPTSYLEREVKSGYLLLERAVEGEEAIKTELKRRNLENPMPAIERAQRHAAMTHLLREMKGRLTQCPSGEVVHEIVGAELFVLVHLARLALETAPLDRLDEADPRTR